VLVDEFAAQTNELEDRLYSYRLDLERDGIFICVHTYKNAAKTFNRLLEDRKHLLELGELEQVADIAVQLKEVYGEIEKQYGPIIEDLSHHESILPSIEH
jgi:hypothetical protein